MSSDRKFPPPTTHAFVSLDPGAGGVAARKLAGGGGGVVQKGNDQARVER